MSSCSELVSQDLCLLVLLSLSATRFACVRLCAFENASAIRTCLRENQDGFSTRFPCHAVWVALGVCDGGGRLSRDARRRSLDTYV
jgi:hypothetical protein